MKYFIYLLLIVLLLGVNVGLFSLFRVENSVPNLLFLLVLLFALDKENYDFLFVAFFSGIFLDFFAAIFPGSFIFSFLILAFLARRLVEKIAVFETDWKLQIVLMAMTLQLLSLTLWGYNLFVYKMSWSVNEVSLRLLERQFLPQFIYNLILFYPMYLLFNGTKGWIQKLNARKYKVM